MGYNILVTCEEGEECMKRFIRYFLEGLLYVIPLAVTVFILYKVFVTVDSWLKLPFPGLGFVLTILGITVIGFLASNVLTRDLYIDQRPDWRFRGRKEEL
jgi:uncharacterized membrane protein